jgi:methyl-accepting chemotaxis protein
MEGDLKALCDDINNLGLAITTMLIENKKMGVDLSTNAHKLSKGVDSLTISANNQAASLEESAAAIEEITSNMKNSSNNIVQMNTYANEVSDSVTQGEELASRTASSMDKINEQTQSIAEAITIIDQIAFQTNILSLNAAVEAATAGEAGKGFAVVAQEVRNLASRSAEAAHEIKELVENATEKTNEGKKISTDMINGYERLNKNIHNTLSLISEVSNASKEQFSAMEQINSTINKLDQVTQQNAVVASEANHVANEVNKIAEKVVENTNKKEFHEEI